MCLLFAFTLPFHTIKAQTRIDTLALRSVLQLSPVVFEGKVEEICSYKDPNTGVIYSNNIVHITKTIKGALQCGNVSIITEGGFYQDQTLKVSHTTEFTAGVSGIFVCRPSNFFSPVGCPSVSNPIPMELIFSEHATIEYFDDLINELAIGYKSKFNDIQDLYNFIEQIAGYSIIDCDLTFNPHTWNNNRFSCPTPVVEADEKEVVASLAAGNQLLYSLNSLEITGTYPNLFFEFNVQVKANDDLTFLEKGTFRFKYYKTTFGDIPSILLTATSDFPAIVYQSNARYISDSTYEISVNALTNASNRTQILRNSAKSIIHVKIPFFKCGNEHKIRLDSFPNAPDYSTFTLTANALSNSSSPYSSVALTALRIGLTCTPEITRIYSLTTNSAIVPAGIKEKVKIEGKNFLNGGKVFILSADDGGNTYLSLDKYDINNWSDTSIIFTLPSRIDSSVVSGLGYLTQPPGSGALYVQNIETQQSNGLLSGLKIPYAATQVYGNRPITGEYYKNNLLLYANSIDSGYTYKLHTSITDENMKNCIRKAIRDRYI
jgi:hypothetical protein